MGISTAWRGTGGQRKRTRSESNTKRGSGDQDTTSTQPRRATHKRSTATAPTSHSTHATTTKGKRGGHRKNKTILSTKIATAGFDSKLALVLLFKPCQAPNDNHSAGNALSECDLPHLDRSCGHWHSVDCAESLTSLLGDLATHARCHL